jgi:TRAP-type transport system periplasmic protein
LASVLAQPRGLAQDKPKVERWLAGELENDAPPITYDGPTITIRHSHFLPRNAAVNGDLHVAFAEWLEKRSNGKLRLRYYWTNTLADAQSRAFEAVSQGIADASQCYTWFDPGRFDLWLGLHLPNLMERSSVGARTLMEIYPEHLRKEYEAQGVYMMRISTTPPNRILSKEPIRVPEDMRGKKLWATGKIPSMVASQLNAVAVPLTPSDLYPAYQTGVIDVMQMHNAGAILFRVAELSKFRNVQGLSVNPVMVCVNPKFFDSLPADLKALYYRGMQMFNHAESETYFDKFAADAVRQMDAMGIENIPLTDEVRAAWAKALQPVEDNWVAEMQAKGLDARAMLDDYRATHARLDKLSDDEIFDLNMNQPIPNIAGSYVLPTGN